MKRTLIKILSVVTLLFCCSACCNKEICPECEKETGVFIRFNWDKVEHIPEGMTVLFYDMNNKLVNTFNNIPEQGELIRIESGDYRIACYNNDTEYDQWHGQNSIDSLQVSTRESSDVLPVSNKSGDIPPVVSSFDFLCCDMLSHESILPKSDTTQIITLTPAPVLDKYSYEVSRIVNSQYISRIACSISGMAGSYYLAHPDQKSYTVIMPFSDNRLGNANRTILGSMLNTGFNKSKDNKNILTLYLWSPGGNYRAKFDVTDQVHNAPDPRNVHIVINTEVVIPHPIDGGEGIDPSVDKWHDLTYDVIL